MKRFKLVVPSFVALIFCALLMLGSTLALFTSQDQASIAVTSGKVDIDAKLTNLELFSADATITNDQYGLAGVIGDDEVEELAELDNYRGTYYFEKQNGTFSNGGTAKLSDNNGTLTIERMTPGDKVTLKLDSSNNSNVDIKARLLVSVSHLNDDDNALLSSLVFRLGDKEYVGLKSYTSAWKKYSALAATDDFNLEIELPLLTGNAAQSEDPEHPRTVTFAFTLQAVQGNAATSGAESIEMVQFNVVNYDNIPTQTQKVVVEETVIQPTEVTARSEEADLTVKVKVPASVTKGEGEQQQHLVDSDSTVTLEVTNVGVTTNNVTEESTVDLDISLKIDDVAVKDVNEFINVEMFVGTGKNITTLRHYITDANGNYVLDNQGNKTYENLTFNYSAQTGILTFQTKSFSPFDYSFKIEPVVASVGEMKYYGADYQNSRQAALKAAIDYALANGGTVKLERELTVVFDEQSFIAVAVNQSLTLDLNGFDITAVSNRAGTSAFITNNGTLTIIDSKDLTHNGSAGSLSMHSIAPDTDWDPNNQPKEFPGYANNTISNGGTLTINGGKLTNNTPAGGATYVIDNNSTNRNTTATINGGFIYNNNNDAIRMFCNSVTNENNLIITGGVVGNDASDRCIWMQLPSSQNIKQKAYLAISGGHINGNITSYSFADKGYFTHDQVEAVQAVVTGGLFEGSISFYYRQSGDTVLSLTGGTFRLGNGPFWYGWGTDDWFSSCDEGWDSADAWREHGYTVTPSTKYEGYYEIYTPDANESSVADLLDSGYELVSNGDGTWSVQQQAVIEK